MADKALIKIDDSFAEMGFDGKWREIGSLHLKVENWSYKAHSHPKFIVDMGVGFH